MLGTSTLLEELKQFIDGTETYRSIEERLVTTTSLGELFVLLEGCSTKTGVPNRRVAFGHLLAEPQAPNVEQPIEEIVVELRLVVQTLLSLRLCRSREVRHSTFVVMGHYK